jgi:hypothetical protein
VAQFGLGAFLVEKGVISGEQLEQALQAQVVYGGRLGTNMVELGLFELDQLAEYLAALSELPIAPTEWVETPDPKAIDLLPSDMAERHGVLPLHVEGTTLHVAMLDPGDARVLGALTRATGRSIRPYLLPELRLLYALERHLGIARPVRFVNVAKKLERIRREAAAVQDDRPEEVRLREALGIGPLGQGEDLIDESSFAALHQRLASAREFAAGGPAEGTEAVASDAEAHAELALDDLVRTEGRVQRTEVPVAELPNDALALEALLDAATDRESAGRAAIALSRLHVATAALLVVHRGMVMGLFGDGGGLASRIEAVLVPIDADSVLARAAHGEPYRGAPPKGALDARVLRALGRADAREIAVLPILLRDRVVNLLYVDAGEKAIAETALGALQALTLCVERTYERLILSRKKDQRA